MRLFDRRSPVEKFWSWFEENEAEIALGPKGGSPLLARALTKRLWAVHKELAWESGPLPDGTNEFTISAEGQAHVAPIVRSLVASAPPIPGWRFVAFRQANSRTDKASFGRRTLSRSDLLLGKAWHVASGKVALEILIRGLTAENEDDSISAAVILMDAVAGEELTMRRIDSVDFLPWSKGNGSEVSIDELPRYLLAEA